MRQCFIKLPNTKKRVENTIHSRVHVFLMMFGDVWKCDETLSRVLYIASQMNLKLQRKQRNKIIKI